jgi:hypothetical protein
MLAAEFGYSPLVIDEQMDMQLFNGHMRYREFSPPVGALLKGILEGLANGGEGKVASSDKSEEEQLAELKSLFGGIGGKVEMQGGEE